ncbi:reverse transcriptase family protein [Aequorivita capsosiphonis]|uniref:reverse transcriptase family protein n=1 Tax=Aequorivita capsosiphonis TaxID=487317 RepID=UPI0003FF5654|nr:reverse transcriptase family protein [Aequorivita capsosiphonis]
MKKRIKDLAFTLKIDKDFLLNLSSSIDSNESNFYRNWNEPKTDHNKQPRFENGVALTRPINAPIKKLKDVQSNLLTNVLYKIKLPEYFFGGLKNKDAVLNARIHQGNKYFFLTNLKNFYPSVHFKSVENALRKEGFYPDVARLITRICTKEGAIPQGCPTSSFLASLVVYHSCDDLFKKYQLEGLKVSVYVDDITFSSPTDFKPRTNVILDELRDRGLKINFEKTHYCTKNPRVTGIQVKNNGICPLPNTFDSSNDLTIKEASRNGHIQRIKYVKKVAKTKKNAP